MGKALKWEKSAKKRMKLALILEISFLRLSRKQKYSPSYFCIFVILATCTLSERKI